MVQNSIYGQSYIGYTWIMFVIVVFIANKRASSERFKEMQAAYISYQEETDKQLEALESKIDNLMQQNQQGGKKANETNDSSEDVER